MMQSHGSTATDPPLTVPGRLSPTTDGRIRFNIDEYLQLAEIGVLTEDDHVELIREEIVHKWPGHSNDRRRRFTRFEYDRMIETGFLKKEEYRSIQQYGDDASISPQAIPDCLLDLGWLFN